MSAVLIFRHGHKSRAIRVTEEHPVRIGRGDPTLEIRVNHISMSRVHARIEKRQDGWYVLDLDSRNGTVVNGKRITEIRLKSGDEITFGKMQAVFYPATGAVPMRESACNKGGGEKARLQEAAALESPGLEALEGAVAGSKGEGKKAGSRAGPALESPGLEALDEPEDIEEGEATLPPSSSRPGLKDEEEKSEAKAAEEPQPVLKPRPGLEPQARASRDDTASKAASGQGLDGAREDKGSREEIGFAEPPAAAKPAAESAGAAKPPAESPAGPLPSPNAQPADKKQRFQRSTLVLGLVAGGGVAACAVLGILLFNLFGRKGSPDAGGGTPGGQATAAVSSASPAGTGPATGSDTPTTAISGQASVIPPTPAVARTEPRENGPEPPLPEVLEGEKKPETGAEPDEQPETQPATPVVTVAVRGPWARVAASFTDLLRQEKAVQARIAGEVQKAIGELPEEKARAGGAIRQWLSRPELEWKFAGACAAEVLQEEAFSSDLFQAIQKVEGDRSSPPSRAGLSVRTVRALSKALSQVAPVTLAPELLKASPGPDSLWAAEVLKGIRTRSPDALAEEIHDYLVRRASGEELAQLVPLMARMDAWGAEISTSTVNRGLQSDDPQVRLRFVHVSRSAELRETRDVLMKLMKSDPDERVKKAAKEALVALGELTPDGDLGQLVRRFLTGAKEDRQKIYSTLETMGKLRDAERALSRDALGLANQFFQAFQESGREKLLTDYFRSGALYLEDGEEAAFQQQLEDEKFLADYGGVWTEHVWLLQNGMAVGLKPKNKEIVKMMEGAAVDKFGNPGWLVGALFVLVPDNGEWKVEGLANMSYASNLTRMLRRQKEELKEDSGGKGKK
ncbi:MAG: FHA domain-containing protein [Planctomycetes bacterium]|nr:FHA domain-containing protein [Planctomycetota bacterium]